MSNANLRTLEDRIEARMPAGESRTEIIEGLGAMASGFVWLTERGAFWEFTEANSSDLSALYDAIFDGHWGAVSHLVASVRNKMIRWGALPSSAPSLQLGSEGR